MNLETPLTNLLTTREIALRLQRSHPGVQNAIKRLGITPTFRHGRVKYYPPGVEDEVRKAMRQPNAAQQEPDRQS